jgi:hypothetical protein
MHSHFPSAHLSDRDTCTNTPPSSVLLRDLTSHPHPVPTPHSHVTPPTHSRVSCHLFDPPANPLGVHGHIRPAQPYCDLWLERPAIFCDTGQVSRVGHVGLCIRTLCPSGEPFEAVWLRVWGLSDRFFGHEIEGSKGKVDEVMDEWGKVCERVACRI